jgi:hypothetical protein
MTDQPRRCFTNRPAGSYLPRWLAALLLSLTASAALLLSSCSFDGHFVLLGYSTRPNYDLRFRTVRVPIFRNRAFWTVTPVPGLEMDLTRAVIRQIEVRTPYKVVQNNADTELKGVIVHFAKRPLNFTQFNTVREAQTILTVDILWRNVQTGEVLSRRARRFQEPEPEPVRQPLLASGDSILPPGSRPVVPIQPPEAGTSGEVGREATAEDDLFLDPVTRKPVVPVTIRSIASFRPELGESITTALQQNIDQLAQQIVSSMELGW